MAFAGRRDLFPPETFPSLWERVEEMIRTGSIRAVDEERGLAKRADGVHEWAKQQTDLFSTWTLRSSARPPPFWPLIRASSAAGTAATMPRG